MSGILTPDQRVRVFVSSTLEELAEEREAARRAIETLRLTPVLFELGARPHPPRELHRAYLEQSHVFVAIYWQRYGWVAPDMEISGLEDELALAGDRPKLVYLKRPAPEREPRLDALLERIRDSGVSYKAFGSPAELEAQLTGDLAALLSERFQASAGPDVVGHAVPVPVAATSFVGRRAELLEVLERLRHPDVRLVTLVGPGGIGKTRLATEVAPQLAAELPDGVAYAPLEAIRDPDLVDQAILRAVDLHERGGLPAADVLRASLAQHRMLLVLDNFEHLMDGATHVADLLAATTGLKILVTSREPLRLRGEHEVVVSSLTAPDALQLFLDRARAGRGAELGPDDLAAASTICEQLDGVPLAIELAAARTRLLSPRSILDRLGDRLDFLVSGPRDLPARHQALRSTIAWSYELLEPEQRRAFAALGTFVDGFTERAAAEVTGTPDVLDLLASLVDKSLVQVETPDGELRLRMLGAIRDYALEQLADAGEVDACRARHAAHFRAVVQETAAPLRTAQQTAALDRLEADAANLQASLEWWAERRDYDTLAEMAWHLWVFAWLRGYLHELRALLKGVLAAPDLRGPARTRLQAATGILEIYCGGSDAVALLDDAVTRARAEGTDDVLAAASMQLVIAGGDGDLDEAVALFAKLGDHWSMAATLCAKAWVHVSLGAFDGADDVFDAALDAAARIDDDFVVAMILANGAERATHRGDHDEAAAMLSDALQRYQRLRGAYPASYAVEAAAHLVAGRGDLEVAVELLAAAEHLRASVDTPIWTLAHDRHRRLLASLRERVGPAAFDRARAASDGGDYHAVLARALGAIDSRSGVGQVPP